ncbi:MAG: hemerythrin family protein [Nitrospirae bacterium]|nr:hemerythrin family protein [Nitrospirota bacterium]
MFKWTPSLSVGVDVIDLQHQELFMLFEGISMDIQEYKGQERVSKALAFLDDYVRKHFSLEEKYMRVLKYPDYDSHMSEHKEFIENLGALREHFEKGDMSTLIYEITGVISHWLVRHVANTDKALGSFLKDKMDNYYE